MKKTHAVAAIGLVVPGSDTTVTLVLRAPKQRGTICVAGVSDASEVDPMWANNGDM